MTDIPLKAIVEGLIMAHADPLSLDTILRIVKTENNAIEINELRDVINELVNDYSGRGIELKEVANGWRFQVRQELAPWVAKLWEGRSPRYSRALLETLALITYRQPITRAEIEEVRGVAVSSNIVKTLLEHEWIKIAGYKEVPGRPALYVTTKKFLDHFNLKSLQELPPLIEFTEIADETLQNNDKIPGIEQATSDATLALDLATAQEAEPSIEQPVTDDVLTIDIATRQEPEPDLDIELELANEEAKAEVVAETEAK